MLPKTFIASYYYTIKNEVQNGHKSRNWTWHRISIIIIPYTNEEVSHRKVEINYDVFFYIELCQFPTTDKNITSVTFFDTNGCTRVVESLSMFI